MDTNSSQSWKPAPGCVGLEVSDHGMLRNEKGKVWPGYRDPKGYYRINAAVPGDGHRRGHLVHRLVLEAFVGPCPDGMETRHLNGDPGDNRLSNIVWGTSAENSQDVLRHGRHKQANQTHCLRGHPLVEGNLVESQLSRGWRQCRACWRAREWHYYRGLSPALGSLGFKVLTDSYLSPEVEKRVA